MGAAASEILGNSAGSAPVFASRGLPAVFRDSGRRELQPGTVAEETHRTIQNVQAILKAAGAELSDVVKCSVFLSDIRDFAEMNTVYGEYFGAAKPARTTVSAQLPAHGLKVEIDCIAYKPAG